MTRLLLLLMALFLAVPAGALPCRLERFPMMASAHVPPRDVMVWLPDSYDGRRRHAALYMHDARNLFDPATAMGGETGEVAEALAGLIAAGKVPPTMIVGIDNTAGRSFEYMPAYAPYQARIDALLAARGQRPETDFVSRAYPGAGHNEAAWRARIAEPLAFLLTPR